MAEKGVDLQDRLQRDRDAIVDIAKKYGASNVRVFGSLARGESHAASDIDFLVDIEKDRSYLDLGGLLTELQDLLGVSVDIVTPESLHWYLRDQILREAKTI
jgi:hypothetical protein